MNTSDHKTDKLTTELVEDLEVSDQQAEEAKGGKGSGTFETYLELELHNTMISR